MSLPTISVMKLTKMEATGAKEWVKLHFSDDSTLRVPLTVVADEGLSLMMEISEQRLARIQETAGLASAKLRAVRIVAASGVSERELRRRLVQKGERPDHAEAAVSWLTELNLVDDAETARRIVEKGAAKGYGAARIRQMLYEKGIDREIWEDALCAMPEPDDAIDRYLSNHLAGQEPDQKQRKKITDALLRRGHSWEDIRAGLARYAGSVEED